ncbi:hypothetical protein EYF80_033801 [Liparis tanakae]|uniref:Uncharacterized protein n=1 Tax=Liparis tanakae TaxID=230148 RepID=A0A4Z2GR71_9TELE|nr:hypothetical protein EYF80_033801 [Liparis tanakae]
MPSSCIETLKAVAACCAPVRAEECSVASSETASRGQNDIQLRAGTDNTAGGPRNPPKGLHHGRQYSDIHCHSHS